MSEKVRVIVTVIALLELMKNKFISLHAIEGKNDFLIRSHAQHQVEIAF
jgi:hypothetical protein